ncbi:MAG: hypothetical protein ACI89X_003202 [Planctomycetota bacterium]
MHGFASDYEGKMKFSVADGKSDVGKSRIEKYGLDVHGMVITDKNDKVLWKESGHLQTKPGIKTAIDKALSGE